MSAKFYTLLTDIGAAKLASATALGIPLKITHMAVGDGGGVLPTPSAQQTALVAERRRAALNMLYIDPQNNSQIIAEQVIPETEGGWWIREVGLFDETGALIAVGNCPESYKPQLTEGSGRTQTVRMVLITSSTDNITLKIDPAVVLATRKYVDDKALELKVYVDDLMAKHLAAPDPHSQYAQKDSPTLTGIPKVPTPAAGNSTKQIANTEFVASSIAAMVDSAPAALDTLNELAAALGNDPNFATTMINALAGKQPLDNTLTNLSGKDVAGLLTYLGLGETINLAAGALQKDHNGGDIPDKDLFVRRIGAARAFDGAVTIGGDANPWTTAEFIVWLESQGAFNHPYWMCKGSWDYAGNKVITDTGCGNICLAGAVVEVMGGGGAITIRVTTPTTTSGGGVASAQFTYINHGDGYAPGWRRDFNTINKPTAGDVGALPVTGGRLNGPLGIGTDNGLGGNSIVLGDNDTGFKQDGDGVLGIYANNARVGYIDNSGLHMSVDVLTNGGIRAGDGKRLSLTSNNNSTMTATFNLWGGADRPTVIELDDDQGWQFYSQRNTDGSISFRVNGQMEPNSYSNFDSRYVQDFRLGSYESGQAWMGPGFSDTPGYVLTAATNGNSDEIIDGLGRRPMQKLIGNQWYNVTSV
ncbi:phage tail protein [Salmonella enterica]|uniref:phage tail protein n=2 Tax=Salmonella enterica TaxID=28901 RepID=UPI001277E24B|nr:phage tail protein [Salmonella enterica]ECD5485680.1 phage tail protein [Salmonella enterica subsp. enterica serovar Brijbhumi]